MSTAILVLLIFVIIILTCVLFLQFINTFSHLEAHSFFKYFRKKKDDSFDKMVSFANKLSSALLKMSTDKVGALIVIEKNQSLQQYINIGSKIESEFLPELIYTIFYNKKSPLHDGAIIVRDWKIVSVSSYLPTSKRIVNISYGARHRAAFGITEKFDCFAFVVSETTGQITEVHLDEVNKLSNIPEKLTNQIIKIFTTANAVTPPLNSKKVKKNGK